MHRGGVTGGGSGPADCEEGRTVAVGRVVTVGEALRGGIGPDSLKTVVAPAGDNGAGGCRTRGSTQVSEQRIRSAMNRFVSPARLGLLLLLCGAVGANEPLLPPPPPPPLPAVPAAPAPAPDCLPKEPPPPVLKVKVRVPAFSAPEQPIEYRICVENCSTAEAHHVVLKNPLPANARFVRADPEPSAQAPELQWQLGTIGGGACREVVLVLQPTNREDVKNCTRVQFEHGQCVTTRQSAYPPVVPLPPGTAPPGAVPPGPPAPGAPPPGTMPPAVEPVPPAPLPKITTGDAPRLTLAAEGHARQYVNLASRYFLTVTNAGKAKATNVLVSCVLPAQTTFERAGQGGQFVQGQVAWVVGDLAPGELRTVELVLRAQAEGNYCVRATARADLGATAQAEACTQFVGVSALHVEMTDRDDPLVVGGRTSYPVTLRNQGSAPITGVRLKALLPPTLRFIDAKGPLTLAPGAKTDKGEWLEGAALPTLEPGASQTYEIVAEARRAGPTRVHVEVSADQLERGPVIEEENTTLFEEAD